MLKLLRPKQKLTSGAFVEPWKTLVRDTVSVNAGQALQNNFTLEAGTKLTALFHVEGGIDDRVQVWLLDSVNYQLFTAHRPFVKTPGTSALIQGIGKDNFKITHDDIYYLLLDNGHAWLLPRKVTLHVDAILPHSMPESEQMQAGFNQMYSQLKRRPSLQTSAFRFGTAEL